MKTNNDYVENREMYVPFGQTGSGDGSLNMVSIGRALLFLEKFFAVGEGRDVRQFPIAEIFR